MDYNLSGDKVYPRVIINEETQWEEREDTAGPPPSIFAEPKAQQPMPRRLIQWTGYGDNRYTAAEKVWPKLPPGVYTVRRDERALYFQMQDQNNDDIIAFPDQEDVELISEIERFWDSNDAFAQMGYRQRRGYLLYGPQGSGKTSLLAQVKGRIIERGGIVFECDCKPALFAEGLGVYRQIEPERPVMCIFEDIDAVIDEWGESELLALLDGGKEVDRVLNMSTTNYPEKLDARITSRPRRFDRVVYRGMPSRQVREFYFKLKLKDKSRVELFTKLSDGLSIAACAEMVISTEIFGTDPETVVKELRAMSTGVKRFRHGGRTAGF